MNLVTQMMYLKVIQHGESNYQLKKQIQLPIDPEIKE